MLTQIVINLFSENANKKGPHKRHYTTLFMFDKKEINNHWFKSSLVFNFIAELNSRVYLIVTQ